MSSVSDIKLIRTDTTLDLSQKAEKRYRFGAPFAPLAEFLSTPCGPALPRKWLFDETIFHEAMLAERLVGCVIMWAFLRVVFFFQNSAHI